LRRVPYLLVVESHDRDERPTWRRVVKGSVVPPVVRGASGILVTGSLARESMLEHGARPDRIRVFANTVDVAEFGAKAEELGAERPRLRAAAGLDESDIAVLCVARLAPEMGIETLLRAGAQLDDRRLAIVLAGDGPQRERLAGLANELGVRLIILGDVGWDRIVEPYVTADIFALLSEREPWGVVVNEAAACGLPLVLTGAVGAGHDLLIDGENGRVVPAGDAATAASALRELADDASLRAAWGARSRSLAAEWGYEHSVRGFVELAELAREERWPKGKRHGFRLARLRFRP
jgi:glycosyltransferase involved in cell wall biosynthesis